MLYSQYKKRSDMNYFNLVINVLFIPGCGLVKGPSLACVTPKQRNTRMLATIPLEDTHLGIHWNHKDFCIDSSYNVFLLNHQQTNSLFSFLYTRKKSEPLCELLLQKPGIQRSNYRYETGMWVNRKNCLSCVTKRVQLCV